MSQVVSQERLFEESISEKLTSEQSIDSSEVQKSLDSAESNHSSKSEESEESPDFLPPIDDPEILRVIAVGMRPVVNRFVHRLHQLNVAHYSEWTPLLRTPNPGEFMRMLTKRIVIESAESR